MCAVIYSLYHHHHNVETLPTTIFFLELSQYQNPVS